MVVAAAVCRNRCAWCAIRVQVSNSLSGGSLTLRACPSRISVRRESGVSILRLVVLKYVHCSSGQVYGRVCSAVGMGRRAIGEVFTRWDEPRESCHWRGL